MLYIEEIIEMKDGGIQKIQNKVVKNISLYGWTGYGLNALDKYDNGNNKWLWFSNSEGEWCVAYHLVRRQQSLNEVSKSTGNIIKGGFIPSKTNIRKNDEDLKHPENKCGIGVYCTPDIKYIEKEGCIG